jgi:phospholipase/lecithinase/hemolysin
MQRIKTTKFVVAALSLASMAVLTACGGGASGQSQPSTTSTNVRVYGDSLADSGTFGFKATVQTTGNYIFPERIAMQFGKTLCPYYAATGTDTFVVNTAQTGCTNYAIAGGVINPAPLTSPTSNRKGIMYQLADGSANAIGATDLIIIDGGGNDAANLISAFLATQLTPGAAANAQFAGLLNSISPAAAAAAASGDVTTAGTTYMKTLADVFYASITTNVLNKGGNRVVFANIPDVTLTPRFQQVLGVITASKGAATAQQLQGLFQSWVLAFNNEFATVAASESRVAVVDIYSNFQDEVAHPDQYSLTNVKDPSCPVTGTDSSGFPTYSFPACTAAAAKTGWQNYLFSDSFHPTPYGHQLASQLISRTLAQKGWL